MVMKILLSVVLTVTLIRAQSKSELLQRGIYLQETMGDLDGAIKIYKQIAETAQQSRGTAAQAEFRLGVCLEKKGQSDEAVRVLKKVITDYPEQTDLVARAKALLPSGLKLLPAPWIDGEILDLSGTVGSTSLPSGAVKMRYSVRSSKTHPGNWVFENRLYNVASMFTMQVEADRETMQPVRSLSLGYHPMLGDTQSVYQDGEVRTEVKGKEAKTMKVEGQVFDSNEVLAVVRRLPLAMGYKTSIPVVSAAGMDVAQMRVTVTAEDDVKTPAGDFRAYRVELNQGMTYWISTDPSHYPVKYEQGTMMTAVLSAIGRTDQPSVYRNEKMGISLNLPGGWTAEEAASLDAKKQEVQFVDSDSQAIVLVSVEPRTRTKPPTLAGMRMEAEGNYKQLQFPKQDLRPDTWQTRQVGGHPALSWVADSINMFGNVPMVLYTTWVRSDSSKAVFSAQVPPADFESFRQRFDQVVDTFTLR